MLREQKHILSEIIFLSRRADLGGELTLSKCVHFKTWKVATFDEY